MTQNYGKDNQAQSGKNVPSDKTKLDQNRDQLKADPKKSEQISSPGADQQYRQNGDKLSDQGGKREGSK